MWTTVISDPVDASAAPKATKGLMCPAVGGAMIAIWRLTEVTLLELSITAGLPRDPTSIPDGRYLLSALGWQLRAYQTAGRPISFKLWHGWAIAQLRASINEGRRRIHYYRSVYNLVTADVRLRQAYGRWQVSAGLLGQYYSSNREKNNDRFLSRYDAQHPDDEVFAPQLYAGLDAAVT
ncbi:MAG: hypothetical protein EOO77_44580, partial [Oxalobacteraceae bacterium]